MDYTRLNDETLLRLIAHSDENALSELYDRYSRLVFSVAVNTLSDAERAEEVTQDVFVRVWEKAHTYSAEQGRGSTWLTSKAPPRTETGTRDGILPGSLALRDCFSSG